MDLSIIRPKIAQLPPEPGVYIFRDAKGKLLYIGKATNLRSRAQSYFRGEHNRGQWITRMVAQVADIDFLIADSVLEALILEANLIKKYQPKYNTMGKDDKSAAYFVVTKEDFPKVLIGRATDIDFQNLTAGKLTAERLKAVYGPYASKRQMQIALKIIRRIFPFHALKQKTEKGCLDFQLGFCPGPYAGAISKEDYRKNIRGIKMILEGKKKSLLTALEKEMSAAARENEFEKAAILRNKIFALQHIRDISLITKEFEPELEAIKAVPIRVEAYDISNISGQNAVGSMVVFENGQPDKKEYRKFKIKTASGIDDVGMMREVLSRRFKNDWPASTRGDDRSSTRGWPMPDLVLLDGGKGHLNMAVKLLQEQFGLAVAVAAVAKGPTRKKLDLRISKIGKIEADIQKIIDNKNLLKRIMDEAHRFAISYHRKLRRKNAIV